MTNKKLMRMIALLMALALFGAACSSGGDDKATGAPEAKGEKVSGGAGKPTSDTPAADLRSRLTTLLQEHVYLATTATGAALRGDTKTFDAFAASLNGPTDSNTSDLVAAVSSVYGDEVGKAFDGLWRSQGHIPAVVNYTQSIAKNDSAGATAAKASLDAYAEDFGKTMNSVNDNIDASAFADGIKTHISTLLSVIDAQKAGNFSTEYSNLRAAYAHMSVLATSLADATVRKFPDKFEKTDPNAKPSDYRAQLTRLLNEHVWLFSSVNAAKLAGRTAEFEVAVDTLNGPGDSNTTDVTDTIKAAYGEGIGSAFEGLWRSEKHIPAVLKYVDAVRANNAKLAEESFAEEVEYSATFGKIIGDVNPNLPEGSVKQTVLEHVTTLRAVIDAQAKGDAVATAATLRKAAHHMDGIADFVADGTVKGCLDGNLQECTIL